jgi:FdhD protein
MTGLETVSVLSYDGVAFRRAPARIIVERTVELWLDGRKVVNLACTGQHHRELAVGYLAAEGHLETRADIRAVAAAADGSRVDVRRRRVPDQSAAAAAVPTISSSGARGAGREGIARRFDAAADGLRLTAAEILSLMEELLAAASLHAASHGTHCSGLATAGGLIVAREDIGRHNTIDMLRGHALLEGIDCRDKILLTTGRVSAEIVLKVAGMGIPVVISHSAPTMKAHGLLGEAGMTLIGYVRGGRMNVYAGEERVIA